MGKPTGFMEYDAKVPGYRNPKERLEDFKELNLDFPIEESMIQGARCMDCGIPFCQMGTKLKGMTTGCPLGNLIPEWNELIHLGLFDEAYERLAKTNNFPEFTGRVCPAPCEGACTNGLIGDSVTIKINEVQIIEEAFKNGIVKTNSAKANGKKVAVVGSGPAGLACADELNKLGYAVTVYERSDRPGGLLTYGIPNMKLDKNEVVFRRTDIMKESGIKFVCNTEVGKDISTNELIKNFDSVVLAIGATNPRDLQVPGRDALGVYFAVDFLTRNTKSLLDSNFEDNAYIETKDKNVIIIGGGDTGTDCVGTSLRHGAASVNQFEIMPESSEERTSSNPWPEYPKVLKVDYGQKENIAVFGKDPRNYLINTKEIVKDKEGNVKAVKTVDVEWTKDENGRFQLNELEGTEKTWEADIVLLAMGFLGTEDVIVNELELVRDNRTNIVAKFDKFNTNIEKVFACGDARSGQSLVVSAIDEGRRCAYQVDKYLN